ncbi:MAG: hypothetical protein QXY20_09520 [Thermofilum sp.]|uniref:hypothetical protein n=1 Tax=Thermofilum sp. TaxID=1961369 RepID=UPI0031670700
MGLREYLTARTTAFQENINDVFTALTSGYFEDIIHLIGMDAQTELSRRMEIRRAWARKVLFNPQLLNQKPQLPPYGLNREG